MTDSYKDERVIREDGMEREDLITLARLRYRKKSPLWKFFNGKNNREKLNFEEMSEVEIENLYQGKRR